MVAIIFFAMGQSLDLHKIGHMADSVVGIVMILLGTFYIIKAYRRYLKTKDSYSMASEEEIKENDVQQVEIELGEVARSESDRESERSDFFDSDYPVDQGCTEATKQKLLAFGVGIIHGNDYYSLNIKEINI